MSSTNTILAALLLSWFCAGITVAQDTSDSQKIPEWKNVISLSILPIIDRTLSLTYARKLKNGNEVTFNPRVKVASSDPGSNTYPGSNYRNFIITRMVVPDPQWYYDQYMLRIGLRVKLNQGWSYEPQLQLAHGSFSNKFLMTEDASGEAYDEAVRLDRKYSSGGIINSMSWTRDYNRVRVKWFVGFGIHLKSFTDTEYAHQMYRRVTTYPEPKTSEYYDGAATFHGGLEVGYQF